MRAGVRSWSVRSIVTYTTDASLGRLFEDAPGVSDATVQRLRNALMGVMER
jgi:hypothetical protein